MKNANKLKYKQNAYSLQKLFFSENKLS